MNDRLGNVADELIVGNISHFNSDDEGTSGAHAASH